MIDQSQVSIIIPHIDLGKETDFALNQCLDSLLETCKCKIIIAFNKVEYGTGFDLKQGKNNRIKILALEEQGQCKSVNAAVATINTPWIFITNNDMVYPPGWFDNLITLRPNTLCLSPVLVEPRAGAPTFEVYFCGGAGGDFDKQKFLEYAKQDMDLSKDGPLFRTGFNLPFLISKELWDLIGGYDINFDPWGSNGDSDLEYKIRLAGVQPYQARGCKVYHFSQTSGTFHPDNQSYWQKNWDYFIEKWGFPRTDEGIWEANFKMPETPLRKYNPPWYATYGEINP